MVTVYDEKKHCCGCGACSQVCPKQCIDMKEDDNGFLYPDINTSLCVDCGKCKSVCLIYNDLGNVFLPQGKCFVYVNNDENYRLESASSGAFGAICTSVEKNCSENVIVFGSELTEDFICKHSKAKDLSDIKKFKKSKYLQSKIGTSFKEAKKYLEGGRTVLFSGTPCQIVALKCYLGKTYDRLYTVDFVCHGVPNQRTFSKYIETIQKKYHSKVIKYNFRNKIKTDGRWSNLGIGFELDNGKKINLNANDDMYMAGFLSALYNRDCCEECKFASAQRVSDITMGDFWGIGEFIPDFDEGITNGTSLILVNTEKGEEIVSNMCENATLVEMDIGDAIKNNGQLAHPQKFHKNRRLFFSCMNKGFSFKKSIERAFPDRFGKKMQIKRKISKLYSMSWYKRLSEIKKMLKGVITK